MSDIFSRVKGLFSEFLSIEEDSINPESTIEDDLGVDSVDIVSIVSELEKEFNLKITDAEAANMKTVGQVVDLISTRVA